MSIIKKIGIGVLAIIIVATGLIYSIFYFKRDFIKDKIVSEINRNIKGKIAIESVGLDLFSDFPYIDIKINNAELSLEDSMRNSPPSKPILKLDQVSFTLNARDLYNGDLIAEKIIINGGNLDLLKFSNSGLNLTEALSPASDTTSLENEVTLQLNSIDVLNLGVRYYNQIEDQDIYTFVNSVKAAISINGDSVKGKIEIDYMLDSLILGSEKRLNEHSLALETDFKADLNSISFSLENGIVKFDLLEANLSGSYNYSDDGMANLTISASHDDLSELADLEILNSKYLPDIKRGKLVLNTAIYGKTIGQNPLIIASADLSELNIQNKFGEVIRDSGFQLQFYSGIAADMSDGLLTLDSVDVNFASGGYLSGKLELTNFAEPSYKINWQLEEQLSDLAKIIDLPGIEEIEGGIRSQARLKGKFNPKNKEISNPEGIVRAQFEDCHLTLSNTDYTVKNLNGQFFMNEGEISLDNFTFDANGNQLKINTNIQNIVPYLLGSPTELITELSVKTQSLNTALLLAFDEELQRKINYKVDSIDLSLKAEFFSRDIDSFSLIPTGNFSIKNLTAKFLGFPLIKKLSGDISINPDTIVFTKLEGSVGESPFNLSSTITNYESYFQTDSITSIAIDFDLQSDQLIAKDFFTVNGEFVLPKSYEEEILKNVHINAKLSTTNFELQKRGLVPEFDFQLTNLNFQTHFSPVKFTDISIYGLIKDNHLYINTMFGKFGNSDIFMNAEFNNVIASVDTVDRPFKSRIGINSQLFDLDELVRLGEANSHHFNNPSKQKSSTNPFADNYPITDLNVNIGKLEYYGAEIKNLSGILELEENNIINLKQVRLESGDYGSFEFDGVIDASSHQEAILTSDVKILNVDLSKLDVSYLQDGKEVKVGDHLAGTFTGHVEANVPVTQDFNFDLSRLSGSIKAVIRDGALLDYAPLQQLGKYFKNKDLNNVYFADLMNTMEFENGKMHLPTMTINSTLGTISLMGYQTVNGDMEFDVKVPVKLVAGAVLNSLFAAKKSDDNKEDEINTDTKGKFLTVHVYGNPENYQFKIGKKHGVEPMEGALN